MRFELNPKKIKNALHSTNFDTLSLKEKKEGFKDAVKGKSIDESVKRCC